MQLYQHKVNYYETDQMGVVHHSNYIRFMEEARVHFFEQIGYGYDEMEKQGIISPVTAVECKYKVSTYFAEVITISVSVEEFKGIKLKLRYEMRNKDNVVVSEGRSEHCFIDRDGRIIRMKKEYPQLHDLLVKLAEGEELENA